MSWWDGPHTVSFRLGGMTHNLSISGFRPWTLFRGVHEYPWFVHIIPTHPFFYSTLLVKDQHDSATVQTQSVKGDLSTFGTSLHSYHFGAHTNWSKEEYRGDWNIWCLLPLEYGEVTPHRCCVFCGPLYHHLSDQSRKGPIYLGSYVTRLARHFGLLDTSNQTSSFTLSGEMVPQRLSIVIHMRIIEHLHGASPWYTRSHSDPQDKHEDLACSPPSLSQDKPFLFRVILLLRI